MNHPHSGLRMSSSRDIVEDELFNGYILQELYHKYESINAVMKAALDNPPPDQLDLGI